MRSSSGMRASVTPRLEGAAFRVVVRPVVVGSLRQRGGAAVKAQVLRGDTRFGRCVGRIQKIKEGDVGEEVLIGAGRGGHLGLGGDVQARGRRKLGWGAGGGGRTELGSGGC